jgi:hypothetical protein
MAFEVIQNQIVYQSVITDVAGSDVTVNMPFEVDISV